MSRLRTSSDLVESIRKRGMFPENDRTWKDQDVIDVINEEIDAGLLSTILELHEEHLVYYVDIPLVAGKSRYDIPYRAVANKLREVSFVSSDGNVYELSRVSIDHLSDFKRTQTTGSRFFYVENTQIVLIGTDGGIGQYLRMHFYLRPNTLVEEKYCGKISDIDRTTGVISLSNFPEAFSSLSPMDFVGKNTPNKIYNYDIQPLSSDMNTLSMTFNVDDIPEELIVGDYLCIQEETPVANIPTELQPLLLQRVAVHILESLGDTEGLANAKHRLEKMEASARNLIDNRVEGAPQKISPRRSMLVESSSYGRLRRRGGKF